MVEDNALQHNSITTVDGKMTKTNRLSWVCVFFFLNIMDTYNEHLGQ